MTLPGPGQGAKVPATAKAGANVASLVALDRAVVSTTIGCKRCAHPFRATITLHILDHPKKIGQQVHAQAVDQSVTEGKAAGREAKVPLALEMVQGPEEIDAAEVQAVGRALGLEADHPTQTAARRDTRRWTRRPTVTI